METTPVNETSDTPKSRLPYFSRAAFGLILVAGGLAILADNFGWLDLGDLGRFWPLALVAVGLNHLMRPMSFRRTRSGLWFVLIGLWLEAIQFHVLGMTFGKSWPVILVLVGLDIVFRGFLGIDRKYYRRRGGYRAARREMRREMRRAWRGGAGGWNDERPEASGPGGDGR
jgi:hypothetical protein